MAVARLRPRAPRAASVAFGVLAVALLLAATVPRAGAATPVPVVPDLAGTYWATEYHARIRPVDGGDPPLNAAGRAQYELNKTGLRNGSLGDLVRTYCLPDAVPRLLSTPYPFQLFQLPPGQVTFVHELNSQVRVVPLDRPLPRAGAIDSPSYEGASSAHYEGDTLVIAGNSFNDQTFLDSSGLPHSEQLETTERIRRIGRQLEDVVTVHDPVFYTHDWQARFVYQRRPGLRLQEYVCGEPHRDISAVKGVPEVRAARAQGRFP